MNLVRCNRFLGAAAVVLAVALIVTLVTAGVVRAAVAQPAPPSPAPSPAPALAPAAAAQTLSQRIAGLSAYWQALRGVGFRGLCWVAVDGRLRLSQEIGGISPRATFDIASIAKPITAVAVLRLAQRGQLSLDSPLAQFFPAAPADKRAITVHQLLTHTGGIGNAGGDTAQGITDRDQAVARILATTRVAPIGRYAYSNDGYTLLAAILEVSTRRRWEDVVRREVLEPAGMTATFFLGDPLPGGQAALAQSKPPRALVNQANWGQKGGAGIFAPAADLLHFILAAADGRLLGPETAQLGANFGPPRGYIGFSRVFSLTDVPGAGMEWSHGGANDDLGHYSTLLYYPDSRTAVVVLGLDSEELRAQVVSGLLAVLLHGARPELPPIVGSRPAAAPAAPITLAGEGLDFVIEGRGEHAVLLPLNPAATALLAARSATEKADLDTCVERTQALLDGTAKLAASEQQPPEGLLGRLAGEWRATDARDGRATEITVTGASPNWVDRRGGLVSFVRVTRPKGVTAFRLYWSGSQIVALGGSVFPNPAPMRLIHIGLRHFGIWNPALGRYADLVLAPPGATNSAFLKVGDRTVKLAVTATPGAITAMD